MREHLYKAKRVDNGEWVYGYFWSNDVGNSFIRVTKENDEIVLKDYEVIPETVGEYTGLTDKNDKKIFEGDIVSSNKRKTWIGRGKVWFGNGAFWCGEREWAKLLRMVCLEDEQAVVIGNVHDNPELLKEDKQ